MDGDTVSFSRDLEIVWPIEQIIIAIESPTLSRRACNTIMMLVR
jgi:hypothetical protein